MIPAVIWTAALIMFGIYPFGEKSILITDLGQQYIEYHAALYDAVTGGDSLIYTWNTGLGMNFIGLFAYYLASPFTMLMFLLPRAAITEAVLLIITLKIATSGLTFSIFLNKALGVRGLTNLIFASLYALSAYPVVYCFNLMWLDAVVLLPLVILASLHTFNTGKIGPLIAVFAVAFFSNFYTAFMVGLFGFLSVLCLIWIAKRPTPQNIRFLMRFLWAAALAAGLTAFLTVPTAFSLKDSQGSLSGDWLFVGLMTDPLTLIGKLSFGAYDSVTDWGVPYIYCGVLTLGLLPVWLLHRGIPRREKIACSVLLGFIFVSMLFSVLDYIWHAAENTVWFPGRYSFVFVFALIACAARAASLKGGLSRRRIVLGFAIAAGGTLSVKLPELIFAGKCQTISGSLWITLAALAVYAVLTVLIWARTLWLRRAAAALLALCVWAELGGNTLTLFRGLDNELRFENRESYVSHYERGLKMKDALKKADIQNADLDSSEFFRVESLSARNANDGMSIGYHSLSHYSSFSRRDTFGFLKNCGMMCLSGNKIFRYFGSTSALDAVLGVRYVFSRYERRAGYVDTGISAGDLTLWENIYSLPLVFFSDSALLNVKSSMGSPFDTLNDFLNSLDGGQRVYYPPLEVEASIEGGQINRTGEYNEIKAENVSTLKFEIYNPRPQHVLLYLDNNFPEFTAVHLNGFRLNNQGERLIRGVMELGMLPEGINTVSMNVSGDTFRYRGLCAASFNQDAFTELAGNLQKKRAPNSNSFKNLLGRADNQRQRLGAA